MHRLRVFRRRPPNPHSPLILLLHPNMIRLPHLPQRSKIVPLTRHKADLLPSSQTIGAGDAAAQPSAELVIHHVDEIDGAGAVVEGDRGDVGAGDGDQDVWACSGAFDELVVVSVRVWMKRAM